MDSWISRLTARAASAGRTVLDAPGGLGIVFTDGNDVFWLLPGEVTSTVRVEPADVEPADADRLWAEFLRVNALRERAVHVLRHYLASVRVRTTRTPSGEWGVEAEGGVSSSLSVGADLTKLAVEGADVYALVASRFGTYGIVRHAPTPRRIDRYLAVDGPPAGEAALDARESPVIAPLIGKTVPQVLTMMGLCRALGGTEELGPPEDLARRIEPKGPIARAVLRFGERLPQLQPSLEMLSGAITFDFADGQDDFSIEPKSRTLARRVRDLGPDAVGDALADEYLALDAGRRRVLSAVLREAADRGWATDAFGGIGLFGIARTTYLGERHRDVKLVPGEALTKLLRGSTPEAALRAWLADAPEFAAAAAARLADDAPVPTLPARPLSPVPPPTQPDVLELTDETIAAMDAFARGVLDAYRTGKDILRAYRQEDRYLPGVDTWMRPADWVAVAERILAEPNEYGWTDPDAIKILLDHDVPRGRELALARLEEMEPHHEVADSEIEMAWRFRHERPEVARKWFAPREDEAVPYAEVRARLGDPVAQRFVACRADVDEGGDAESNLTPPRAGEDPGPLRQRLLDWARTVWTPNPPSPDPLRTARAIGAPEVADALNDNPHLLPLLLTFEVRGERMDEPGLLIGEGLVLAWSALRATPLLARVVATAALTDRVLAEARRCAEAAAARNPKVKPASVTDMYEKWLEQMRLALAIAWTRYRHSPPGGADGTTAA